MLDILSTDPAVLKQYSYREFPILLIVLSLLIVTLSYLTGETQLPDDGLNVNTGLSKEEVSANLTQVHKYRILESAKQIKLVKKHQQQFVTRMLSQSDKFLHPFDYPVNLVTCIDDMMHFISSELAA